jgi:hypothetical protein
MRYIPLNISNGCEELMSDVFAPFISPPTWPARTMTQAFLSALRSALSPLATILGTNEIASAAAIHPRCIRRSVVLCHDPLLPVIRYAMAFHDAPFDERPMVEQVGERACQRVG